MLVVCTSESLVLTLADLMNVSEFNIEIFFAITSLNSAVSPVECEARTMNGHKKTTF